jgi:hypothetical protein
LIARPVGILSIDRTAFTCSSCNCREPILLPKKIISPDSDASIEEEVKAKLLQRFESILPFILTLIFFDKHLAHCVMRNLEVGVFDDLSRFKFTYLPMNPTRHQYREESEKT